jgi:hypothetical protein
MNERADAGDARVSHSRAAKIPNVCTRTVRREIVRQMAAINN